MHYEGSLVHFLHVSPEATLATTGFVVIIVRAARSRPDRTRTVLATQYPNVPIYILYNTVGNYSLLIHWAPNFVKICSFLRIFRPGAARHVTFESDKCRILHTSSARRVVLMINLRWTIFKLTITTLPNAGNGLFLKLVSAVSIIHALNMVVFRERKTFQAKIYVCLNNFTILILIWFET